MINFFLSLKCEVENVSFCNVCSLAISLSLASINLHPLQHRPQQMQPLQAIKNNFIHFSTLYRFNLLLVRTPWNTAYLLGQHQTAKLIISTCKAKLHTPEQQQFLHKRIITTVFQERRKNNVDICSKQIRNLGAVQYHTVALSGAFHSLHIERLAIPTEDVMFCKDPPAGQKH